MIRTLLTQGFLVAAAAAAVGVAGAQDPPPPAGPTTLFTCTQHGPKMMTLTLAVEPGLGGRAVIITGVKEGMSWKVCIAGKDATPTGMQTPDAKTTVPVRAGDKITWQITDLTHGVTFADQAQAQAMLDIDEKASKKLSKRMEPKFKGFGMNPWGTDAIKSTPGETTVLVVATVKAGGGAKK